MDENGFIVLPIKIENELSDGVSGDIIFEDDFRQNYGISAQNSEDIYPQDDSIIKEITATSDTGVICEPFILEEDEEPKRKFHIVSDGEGGCVILPASEQYHEIAPTTWYEDGEIVKQTDYFNPGTKEAILKTEAHGNNPASTTIFQAREPYRRSAGFGLMVIASGAHCLINELSDEIGIQNI